MRFQIKKHEYRKEEEAKNKSFCITLNNIWINSILFRKKNYQTSHCDNSLKCRLIRTKRVRETKIGVTNKVFSLKV